MVHLLDVKRLRCPLPVLRAKKALKAVPPNEELTVLATDTNAIKDFQAFCATTGDTLVSTSERDGVLTFVIRKSP